MKTMKALSTLLLVLGGHFAFADSPQVKLTSFIQAGTRTTAAELCGKVIQPSSELTTIRILVDEESERPSTYYALAGKDGKFCITVVTYRGTAVANIVGQTAKTSIQLR